MKCANVDIGTVATKAQTEDFWETPFEFKNSEAKAAWRKGFENQGEDGETGAGYGRCPYVFAARWARRIENALAVNPTATVSDVADRLCTETDNTEGMGISGAQFGFIRGLPRAWWRHGDSIS